MMQTKMPSAQIFAAGDLMARYHDYAKSIGCTTYPDGPLCDSIEVHTIEQWHALQDWWAANTAITGASRA